MKKEEKVEFVSWMKGQMEKAPSLVLADFRGLSVARMMTLRDRCREAGVEVKVAKNTLIKLSIKGTQLDAVDHLLVGPTLAAWSLEDPGAPARTLANFAREKGNENLKIKGAAIGKRAMNPVEVRDVMANLPTREQLLGKMAGLINAGPQQLLGVLSAGPMKLARLLSALKAEREKAQAA